MLYSYCILTSVNLLDMVVSNFAGDMMKIDMFQDPSVFEKIMPGEWNALLASAATNVIFLTWEWQSTWWKHMHPGEILALTYRNNSGQLQGIVPLFLSRSDNDSWILSIIGCEDLSDYLDIIISSHQEEIICSELLAFLVSEQAPHWDTIQFCSLPPSSTAYRVLADQAEAMQLVVRRRIQERCPVIKLPTSWEQYLTSLDKKQRHEIRRKLRRAETQADINWYVVDPQTHDLAAEMEVFIELHRLSSSEKDVFMDGRMKGFFFEMAKALAERQWLNLSFIEMNGQKAAGLLSFDYNDEFQVYNSGYDVTHYGHLSPGIVLTAYAIRQAIERGRRTFDFLRGDEEYKYRMGAEPTDLYELTISRDIAN